MERPLYTAALKAVISDAVLESGDVDLDAAALYSQVVIDKTRLVHNVRNALEDRSQITLGELCEMQPLQNGLSELVAYLQLCGDDFKAVVDEGTTDAIVWYCVDDNGEKHARQARLPRVIFVR
jgi:hypothetical protein